MYISTSCSKYMLMKYYLNGIVLDLKFSKSKPNNCCKWQTRRLFSPRHPCIRTSYQGQWNARKLTDYYYILKCDVPDINEDRINPQLSHVTYVTIVIMYASMLILFYILTWLAHKICMWSQPTGSRSCFRIQLSIRIRYICSCL